MTQKSCAVGMRNVILRNHLNEPSTSQNTCSQTQTSKDKSQEWVNQKPVLLHSKRNTFTSFLDFGLGSSKAHLTLSNSLLSNFWSDMAILMEQNNVSSTVLIRNTHLENWHLEFILDHHKYSRQQK